MDDPEDSTSESSETVIDNPGEDEAEKSANEIIEDKTGDIDDPLSEGSPPRSIDLNNDLPAIKPRPYQLEMVEESLKQNIIVAASN
jgi:hypothetical protein